MEIYILSSGNETGPFDEDTVQVMLRTGRAAIGDLAWSEGHQTWEPLHAILFPPTTPSSVRRAHDPALPIPSGLRRPSSIVKPAEPEPVIEPATDREKAFLCYMGIAFPTDLSQEKASMLVNQTIERPKDPRKLQRWNIDRLRLHPDLFAEEIKERKENRATHYLEVCEGEGAEYFEKVTKAHTKVLVDYLDVRFPNWDEKEDEAAHLYFFPAVSEKFPQLVKRNAKGRFKFPGGPKVAKEVSRKHANVARAQPKSSPFGAMMRGLAYGLIILGLMFFGSEYFKHREETTVAAIPGPATSGESVKGVTPDPPSVPVKPVQLPANPPRTAATAVAPVSPNVPVSSAPAVTAPSPPAPAAPTNDNPVANMNLFGEEPTSQSPGSTASRDAEARGMVMTVSNPFDPLALTAPVPLPPARPPKPEGTSTAAPAPVPAAAPGRTSIKLTKPTMVPLRFGSSMLRVGTVLQLVSVNGDTVRVKFGPDVVSIPTENTDANLPAGSPGQ